MKPVLRCAVTQLLDGDEGRDRDTGSIQGADQGADHSGGRFLTQGGGSGLVPQINVTIQLDKSMHCIAAHQLALHPVASSHVIVVLHAPLYLCPAACSPLFLFLLPAFNLACPASALRPACPAHSPVLPSLLPTLRSSLSCILFEIAFLTDCYKTCLFCCLLSILSTLPLALRSWGSLLGPCPTRTQECPLAPWPHLA